MPLLEAGGITKWFGAIAANQDVSFQVSGGEIVALLGENGAGKTTLMNILFGLYRPDAGVIRVRGEQVSVKSPQHALSLGIGMVHQHFTLVENMTVAENIALGPAALPTDPKLDEVSERVQELARAFGIRVDPRAEVGTLALGQRQRVEILKLLYGGAQCLILDEPTAVLVPEEWHGLRELLVQLAADGRGIVFITHKLGEVLEVGHRAVVLRKGRVVGESEIATATREGLAATMVGGSASDLQLPAADEGEPPAGTEAGLRLDGVSVRVDGHARVDGLSLEVRRGEILGLAGVAGNGQGELVEAIIGLREADGEIEVGGTRLGDHSVADYRRAGGGVVPEDRRHAGLALELSVWENLVMNWIGRESVSRGPWIDRGKARDLAARLAEQYRIDTPDLDTQVAWLSGGNQQKVVLARELAGDVPFLLAVEPTRGLDIGAARFVRGQLRAQRAAGAAILMLSSELEELVEMADRVAVISDGRIVGVVERGDLSIERIGMFMTDSGAR